MAIRYYLIPFETDPAKKICPNGAEPKYISLFNGDSQCLISKKTNTDRLNKTWLRDYYIAKIDSEDFTVLDAQSDVIHLTKQKLLNNIDKIQALGIDTTGFTINTTRQQIEKRILKWLIDDDSRDFERI